MKKTKLWLGAILVCLTLAVLLPHEAQAAEVVDSGECGENLTWTLTDDGTLTISGEGAMWHWSGSANVPWNSYRSAINRVMVGNNVTTVGNYAFCYCDNLTGVEIGDGVSIIGDWAFYKCGSLSSVEISGSVTCIGYCAFFSCSNLQQVFYKGTKTEWFAVNLESHNNDLVSADRWYVVESGRTAQLQWWVTDDGFLYLVGEGGTPDYQSGTSPWYEHRNMITNVWISRGISTIGTYTFGDCTALEFICYNRSPEEWGSVDIGENNQPLLEASSVLGFGACGENLTWTIANDGVLTISGKGAMDIYRSQQDAPWYDCCTEITSLVIGDQVTRISIEALTQSNVLEDVMTGTYLAYCTYSNRMVVSPYGEVIERPFNEFIVYGLPYRIALSGNMYMNGEYILIKHNTETDTLDINFPETLAGKQTHIWWNSAKHTIDGVIYEDSVNYVLDDAGFDKNNEYIWFFDLDGYLIGSKDFAMKSSGACGENLSWTITTDGVLIISGEGAMWNWQSHSDTPWASQRGKIKEVKIGDSVTSVGEYAFASCDALTSVVIGDSVTSINNYAFYECYLLENVTIGNGVTTIGDYAFYGCSSLESVEIPDSVTSIGEYAFYDCTSLASIKISDSLTTIGGGVFVNCSSLESVEIPDSVIAISDYAFYGCTALTGVVIPDGVKTIGASAFYGCSALTGMVIGDSVTSIGSKAFSGCIALTNIEIPNSVEIICRNVFLGCDRLTDIMVNSENQYYCSVDGVLFNKNLTTIVRYPAGKEQYSYKIPDSVIAIGEFAFYQCHALTSVVIGDGITRIPEHCFAMCTNLERIKLPSTIDTIEANAFTDCSKLTTVNYIGSEEEWESVWIISPNDELASAEVEFNCAPSTGLHKDADGKWRYYVNDAVATDYTGLVKHTDGKTYYVYKGVVPMSYTGLYNDTDGQIYYIYYGVAQKDYVGLYAHTNGVVYYIDNGVISTTYTGLYAHSDGNTYYVYKGVIPTNYVGLCYHTDGKTYYIFKGVAVSSYTGLYNHTDGKVYYVNAGVIDPTFIGLYTHTTGATYYVYNGVVMTSYVGLYLHTDGNVYYVYSGMLVPSYEGFYFHSDNKLYYMYEGKIAVDYTGLALHTNGSLYYVVSGVFDPSFNGRATDRNGNEYEVVNGIAQP